MKRLTEKTRLNDYRVAQDYYDKFEDDDYRISIPVAYWDAVLNRLGELEDKEEGCAAASTHPIRGN